MSRMSGNKTGRVIFNNIIKTLLSMRDLEKSTITNINYSKQHLASCDIELSKPFKYELDMETLKKNIQSLEIELANEGQAGKEEAA